MNGPLRLTVLEHVPMPKETEKPVYEKVLKRLRTHHGERGVNVLKAFWVLFGVVMFISLMLIVYEPETGAWAAYLFGGTLVLLFLSPFVVAFVLEVFALVAPKRHALWKTGAKSKEYRLPEARDKYQARKHLDSLSPYDFEEAVAEIYRGYGYKVTVTQKSGDYGVDLLMRDKKGRTYAVQVKQLHGSVGRPTLQRLQGALLNAEADVPIIVTLSYFTEPAKVYAQQHGIQLVDGERLLSMYLPGRETPARQ